MSMHVPEGVAMDALSLDSDRLRGRLGTPQGNRWNPPLARDK